MVNSSQDLNSLLSLVLDKLKDDERFESIMDHGPLEINAFSITFWVKFAGSSGQTNVYVKIPKYVYREKKINSKSLITDADQVLANDEYNSLDFLSSNWDQSFGVDFAKSLGYIREYNAILTKHIDGKFFFKAYRKSNFFNKFRGADKDPIMLSMYNIGKSLYAFHSLNETKAIFRGEEIFSKLDSYISYLKNCNVNSSYLENLYEEILEYKNFEAPSSTTNNLKGIDVRQIFINKSNTLSIIDPGKITRGFREVDLARFIVTCRILYWGTIAVFLKITPTPSYEQKFLTGYFEDSELTPKVLNLLIIKEFFKQWKMTHESLLFKKWPNLFKYFVKRIYLDPFYKYLINKEILALRE